MSITILKPPDPAKVKAGAICVQGTSTNGTSGSVVVKAKVYAEHKENPPANPPEDAVVGTAGTNFGFTSVAGAIGSENAPYPDNTLVVWASYPPNPSVFEHCIMYFQGKTSLKNDCEPP